MKPNLLRSSGLLALLAVAGCSATADSIATSKAPPAVADTSGEGIVAAVAHEDPRVATPSFVWLSRDPSLAPFADAETASLAALHGIKKKLRLSDAALATVEKPLVHDVGSGAVVVKMAQRIRGREVFRAGLSVVLRRSFEPVAATGMLAPSVDGSDAPFVISPKDALAIAFRRMTGTALPDVGEGAADGDTTRFVSHVMAQPSRVKEVYFPGRDAVSPAYRVELLLASGAARSYVVAAADGAVLFENDLVRHEDVEIRAWASQDTLFPMDGPQGNGFAPHPTGLPDGSKITYVAPQLVRLQNFPFSKNDPWLPAGATETRGNNVDAYADVSSPNGFSTSTSDTRANSTAANVFDWTYDTSASPNASAASVKGAVSHLFFTLNFLHDWFYDAGFDEKSGNHQADNLGRGGRANDRLLAEAQDYSGRNNANAATPADGASPRIQMYIFAGQTTASLVVDSPASIAGTKNVGVAGAFGKDKFVTSGVVVAADDTAGADDKDGCEALTNTSAVAGKIVLVHRGNCSFSQKAQRVQAAGGIGVIVANVATSSSAGTAPFMGGQANDITIPALSLNLADGQALENALAQAPTVTMRREGTSDLDGALDTSIVAHEWGHVLSNRLVGNGDGLVTNQAGGLGEGWGDFTAQLLLVRADDVLGPQGAGWNGVYSTGTYATSGSGDDSYFGIRRQPYSTDLKKNGLTFKHISDGVALPRDVPTSFGEDGSNNSEVHATGEVWAQMLWECYAALLRDPRHTFAQAQDKMKKYLVEGLKATPVDPTLLEARDAMIAVAYASDEQDFQSFWKAFAKRGAGVGATGPGKASADNGGANESFVVGNELEIVGATLLDDKITCDHDGILDSGEVGRVEIAIRNSGAGTLDQSTIRITSRNEGVVFANGGSAKIAPLKPFEIGKVVIEVTARGTRPLEALDIDVNVADPTLAVPRIVSTSVPAVRDADEAEGAATKDEVQTNGTSWTVAGKDRTRTSEKWKRVRAGRNQYWSIPNAGEPSDHTLTSAAFSVKGAAFELSFKHRWAFESSARRRLDFDGGVVEVSLDDGATWKDASEYGTVGYNVTLDDDADGTNPLKGRRAFGNTSEGYPNTWHDERISLATGPSETVRVRFRAGADDNTGEVGWDVDDIELGNVASKPFVGFVAHREQCDENGPKANAGAAKTAPPKATVKLEGSATHPKNLPVFFAWTQVEGPSVTLEGADTATPTFVAPADEGAKVAFVLHANDGTLLSAGSRVDVTVTSAVEPIPEVSGAGCGCHTSTGPEGGFASIGLGAIVLGVVRRRRKA